MDKKESKPPKSSSIPPKRRIYSEILKENYTFAITLIDREISEKGKDPELLYNFAVCCSRTGNHNKCVSVLEELLLEFPRFYERDNVFRMEIYSLIEIGKYKEALEKTEERLKLAVDDIMLLSLKASAQEKSGEVGAAIETHMRILRLQPEHKNSLNSLGYLLLNDRSPNNEELKIAIDSLRKALQLSPENPAYLDSFGVLLAKLGKTEEARKAFLKALQGASSNDTILEHLKNLSQSSEQGA
ncbi:hypothetical protein CH373_02725 [Leptospira perolatii]|uniref:Uncharacterized protein n=1 Tax=Leptospira perolatii TaxID=2023191 RepID=A0A2M9ZSR6_9LEPT|nr:hypothetical protein [Leptospira perolatii]PJZ71429.1 hypothetical protein CH360_02725 [Leptospira perolatii]PJZ74963.1 hypothetical protein CH373_02725 [Leptospira perolatii]